MTNEELLDVIADELEENRGLVSNPILLYKTIRIVLLHNKQLSAANTVRTMFAEGENHADRIFSEHATERDKA